MIALYLQLYELKWILLWPLTMMISTCPMIPPWLWPKWHRPGILTMTMMIRTIWPCWYQLWPWWYYLDLDHDHNDINLGYRLWPWWYRPVPRYCCDNWPRLWPILWSWWYDHDMNMMIWTCPRILLWPLTRTITMILPWYDNDDDMTMIWPW